MGARWLQGKLIAVALLLLLLLFLLLLLLLSPHHPTCWLYLSTDAAAMRVEPGQIGRRATNTPSGRTPRVWSRSWAPPAPALYDALRRNTPTCCKQRWIICQLVDNLRLIFHAGGGGGCGTVRAGSIGR